MNFGWINPTNPRQTKRPVSMVDSLPQWFQAPAQRKKNSTFPAHLWSQSSNKRQWWSRGRKGRIQAQSLIQLMKRTKMTTTPSCSLKTWRMVALARFSTRQLRFKRSFNSLKWRYARLCRDLCSRDEELAWWPSWQSAFTSLFQTKASLSSLWTKVIARACTKSSQISITWPRKNRKNSKLKFLGWSTLKGNCRDLRDLNSRRKTNTLLKFSRQVKKCCTLYLTTFASLTSGRITWRFAWSSAIGWDSLLFSCATMAIN